MPSPSLGAAALATQQLAVFTGIVSTVLVPVVAAWSGPAVKVRHNAFGISALEIDGEITAPGFLEGNTDAARGNITEDFLIWRFTVQQAAKNGVGLFSVDVDVGESKRAWPRPGFGSMTKTEDDLAWTNKTGQHEGLVLSDRTKRSIQLTIDAAKPFKALIIARLQMSPGTVQADGKTGWPAAVDMNMQNETAYAANGCTSLTEEWKAQAAPRVATLMELLDAAFPGYIAGAHLESLAAGENTYNWQPGDFGWPDYGEGLVSDYCGGDKLHANANANCFLNSTSGKLQAPLPVHRAAAGVSDYARVMGQQQQQHLPGFAFASHASADFNAWLSRNVQDNIARHAAEVKRISNGKALVMAFYGYINELGDMRVAGGGHLALKEFFEDPNIDAAVSPDKYSEQYRRPGQGPWAAMGVGDSPRLHKKLWIAEDDARTSFVGGVNPEAFARSCDPPGTPNIEAGGVGPSCDRELMRRNLYTAVLHGSGLYQFEITMTGWFGNRTRSTDTEALWKAIGDARKVSEALWKIGDNTATSVDLLDHLEPEIALFIDDESLGHLRLQGAGASAIGPASWLDQMIQDVALLGAPYRHYLLKDLDSPQLDLSRVKLAILPNAFKLGRPEEKNSTRARIEQRLLSNKNITTMFYFAPGIVDAAAAVAAAEKDHAGAYHHADDHAADPADPLQSMSDLVGCPLRRLGRPGSLETEIVPVVVSTTKVEEDEEDSLRRRFAPLVNQTFGVQLYPSPGDEHLGLSPRLALDEQHKSTSSSDCAVVGRLATGPDANATNPDGSFDRAGTLIWNRAQNSVFSTSPVTTAPDGSGGRKVLRAIAEQAGVFMFLQEASAVLRGDSVEAAGAGMLLRGGGLDKSLMNSTTLVTLPPRKLGNGGGGGGGSGRSDEEKNQQPQWRVRGERGETVCQCCGSFSVFLPPGTVQFMFVEPCSSSASSSAVSAKPKPKPKEEVMVFV